MHLLVKRPFPLYTCPRSHVWFWGWADMWFLTRPQWCLRLDEAEPPDPESQTFSKHRPWNWPQRDQGGWGAAQIPAGVVLLKSGAQTLSCSLLGYYMYIEASRPRVQGDKARLLSPLFNVTSVRGPKGSGRVPYCVSFYYHMKGKHIGECNDREW